MYGYLIV